MKSNLLLWAVLGGLLAAVSALAVYRAWPLLFPDIAVSVPFDPACDLRAGPCSSKIDSESEVRLAIEPREIPLVKPLRITVNLQGLRADMVEVDFSGVDMNMGFNRIRLDPVAEGVFAGDGILPVCVRDAMEWEAKVLITSHQGLTAVAYRFITVRPGLPVPGHVE